MFRIRYSKDESDTTSGSEISFYLNQESDKWSRREEDATLFVTQPEALESYYQFRRNHNINTNVDRFGFTMWPVYIDEVEAEDFTSPLQKALLLLSDSIPGNESAAWLRTCKICHRHFSVERDTDHAERCVVGKAYAQLRTIQENFV